MPRRPCVILVIALTGALLTPAAAQDTLIDELTPFLPYIGKTWKAEVARGADQQPLYDVARWERALNGRAIRVLHSVDEGAYGGETILMWDKREQSLVFYYFTTAGFHTHGTTTLHDGVATNIEAVVGNDEGVTRVESTSMIDTNGAMIVTSRMLKNGEWQDERRVVYYEAPGESVTFR